MNVKETLNVASEELMKIGSLDARLEAEVLLRHVLKIDRATMFRDLDEDVSIEDSGNIASLVKRRTQREPLAYITGAKEFYGLPFVVSEEVLIPRQETELLVDTAIVQAKSLDKSEISIVDVGTGSGAIAVSLALNIPTSSVIAVDISESALTIADDNRRAHGLYSRVKLRRGNLLEPIVEKIDILVSNPPYIRSDKLTSLQEEVLQEPMVALDGGYDGLELIKKLLFQAVDKMSNPSVILFEIDSDQAAEAVKLSQQFFPSAIITVLKDLSNNERAVLLEIR
ncbi:MAG: peptide chain release factor N(5)-glutamine methyltransferase [SAR202 cluster bacterium]|jgi:release factor glutamine methyltransferase|nr:peptide chain release factor N(5)-glutamine methyltransferase [SAR202 cluster bacterium]HJO61088.1 peptide chain release factor N(5)-glutamine methyltransferase [SAR202 cluster bacterium]|tara:strand:- start:28036 stop:28884 length:849 start_codon:yes stop_codon:yes gene_type:complete